MLINYVLIVIWWLLCRVPEEDPSGHSVVLNFGDYLRLRNVSKVLTQQEKILHLEEEKLAKEKALVSLIYMDIRYVTIIIFYP